MSGSLSALHDHLLELTNPILDSLEKTNYSPPDGTPVNIKSIICTLLKTTSQSHDQNLTSFKNSTLALALLITSQSSTHTLSWIPEYISSASTSAFRAIANEYYSVINRSLVVDLLPEVAPLLKERIQESSIDKENKSDEVFASSSKVPVVHAILAAYQFRWFVTQIEFPLLGKLCHLVIPCGLTALDHWLSEIKRQCMIAFIHLAKNVNAAELGVYEDAILDACCQNIPSADEIWHLVVEMSVHLVTKTQKNNCRSLWFERMLNEMLSHLERQPRNKDRRLAWLKFIEPLFSTVGLVLLAHFRHIFPLFFKWLHADDDETVLLASFLPNGVPISPDIAGIPLSWVCSVPELSFIHVQVLREAEYRVLSHIILLLGSASASLSFIKLIVLPDHVDYNTVKLKEQFENVLKRIRIVTKLTWIRNTPYVERLVDEFTKLYKESALRKAREEIRTDILQILILLQQCQGLKFETLWDKYKDDPNLKTLGSSLSERIM